jgi:hypothetical protein
MIRPTIRITLALGLAVAMTVVAARLAADGPEVVQLRDDCDTVTFDAAIGDGTCNPAAGGDTTFQAFVADVLAKGSVDEWRFNNDHISNPKPIVAQNRGGETHTFTRVANFGDGSIAPPLNDLLHKTAKDIAPECITDITTGHFSTFVPSGTSANVNDVKGGDKFQCCIHPWMRTSVRKR